MNSITGTDPSFSVVGETAHVFFVANPCAGILPWKLGEPLLWTEIIYSCSDLERVRRHYSSETEF